MGNKREGSMVEGLKLDPGEHWVAEYQDRVQGMDADRRGKWIRFMAQAGAATTPKPSPKWTAALAAAQESLAENDVRELVIGMFQRVPEGRCDDLQGDEDRFRMSDENQTTLRGLVWILAANPWPDLAAELADLLVTAIKKIKWQGPRAVKLANACIFGLGEMAAHQDEPTRMSALAQLAKLKARVSFKTTLNAIQKALVKAADAAGISLDELEELGVPSFGFRIGSKGGQLEREIGGAKVVLQVAGAKVVALWTNDKGKAVKSPPAAVKRDHPEEIKTLKRTIKDAEAILTATRSRLDGLYLAGKSWPLADWRERYEEHGLVGALTRRLIWTSGDQSFMVGAESNPSSDPGTLTDCEGQQLVLEEDAVVTLWHPIGRAADEVIAWRRRIEESEIVQPFKQAHREVYVLTDAERTTGVYSNRFAAHVVKQHQYNALATGRGWRNVLRLMVDDFYEPTSREISAFGLRAEFWVEGIGDDYEKDATEAGSYFHLSTDQVRFYRADAAKHGAHAGGGGYESTAAGSGEGGINEPVPLTEIPDIVLSEIMRDVDLFVGVTSVANDPSWMDGGREERFATYWEQTSFGELSATAETRRELLERLVPRLKIAGQCRLEGRFLEVQGTRRLYKIHLGSGNIMMAPTDEYLCIVPDRRKDASASVHLPFEGDRTLSIILSKAFLLAADDKITDPTILSQIARG